MSTDCLKSTVKNTSGGTKTFSFLPNGGATLSNGQEKTYVGDIVSLIARKSKRDLDAFVLALDSGAISIVSGPSCILYDEFDDVSQKIGVANSQLFASNPDWIGAGSSENITYRGKASGAALLLDNLPQFRIAVATKKLRTAYTGNCFQVRESGGSATNDFGFVNNVVDSAGYDAFCGANSGYLASWFDQSGSGNDLTQSTTTLQPLVVTSGAVELVDGNESVKFAGHYLDSGTLAYTRPFHRFIALSFDSMASNHYLWDGQVYDTASLAYFIGTKILEAYNGSSIKITAVTHPTKAIIECLFNSSNSLMRLNDTSLAGNTGTGTLPTKVRVGASANGTVPLLASVLAFLEFDGELTEEQVTTVRNGLNDLYGVY